MAPYYLNRVDRYLVPKPPSPVTRAIDCLGHVFVHAKKMERGLAETPHAAVR